MEKEKIYRLRFQVYVISTFGYREVVKEARRNLYIMEIDVPSGNEAHAVLMGAYRAYKMISKSKHLELISVKEVEV